MNKLQNSVESEEKKWHAKVYRYEQDLQTTRAELQRIKADKANAAEVRKT